MAKKGVTFEEPAESTANESESEQGEELSRRFNKFQFLELVDNPELEEELDEGQVLVESEDCSSEAENNKCNSVTPVNHTAPTKSKNRKRRNRNKNKNSSNKLDKGHDEDDLLDQLSQEIASDPNIPSQNTNDPRLDLLKINLKYLVPENELKRMFGKEVLKEERSDDQAKGKKHFIPGSSRSVRSRFVSNLNHETMSFFLLDIGPKMDLDELLNRDQPNSVKKSQSQKQSSSSNTSNQPVYFKYVHDKSYQETHKVFINAAQRGYTEEMYNNLRINPGHVESLIQLSDVICLQEEYKTAGDMVEKALVLFERGFHQKFSLTSATCRLSYKRPENRTFFITLFKHINYLNRRGMRKTPLEYTKLLLSLDPENDPLFAAQMIDFYALRAEEYDYLINFITQWKHLSKLPNMSFSLALAYFLKHNKSTNKRIDKSNLELADKSLQSALLRYPNFVVPLLDACSGEPSAELLKSDYFNYTVYTNKYKLVPESIELVTSLYIQRNLIFWKSKDILSWLERNLESLVTKFNTGELFDAGENIKCWARFEGPLPRNLLRHAVLSDFKVKLPRNATRNSYLDIDPYPPSDAIISYSVETTPNAPQATNTDPITGALGLSSLFIRSIIPGFNANEEQDRNQPAGDR